ncbi:hypothetical protein CASFOL_038694 [Castilleja foliolosa]|uniref:PPPDE domain-containing protein n=1 Tax=Castilleja foliolosa TaxID=1961234 RepID=A0ABD3BLN6_9LAMI
MSPSMLCRKSSVKSGRGSVPVHLNVYDLTSANGYAYWFGLGVYHSGVEVHGVEYAYGAHENPTTGIFEGEPKQCDGFTFRKSILIGYTDLSPGEVRILMKKQLSDKYKGNAYNLISKNCNHFCNDASLKLTGDPIPNWVNRLARIGFLCKCVIPANLNKTKVRDHKMEDKVSETDKKKLKSYSCRLTNSSSNTSSSPPLVAGGKCSLPASSPPSVDVKKCSLPASSPLV